jgi:hypothetical protein
MRRLKKSKNQWLPVLIFLIGLVIAVVLSFYYVLLPLASDDNETSWLLNFILSLISAGIATGFTAFATYKISHGLENKKEERNKQAQIDFNIRVVQLISSEIQYYLEILEKSLLTSSKPVPYESNSDRLLIDLTQLERITFRMSALPKSYSELPTETRVKVFHPDDLEKLELGYRCFNQLLADLQYKINSRTLTENNVEFSKTNLDECVKNLNSALDTIAAIH